MTGPTSRCVLWALGLLTLWSCSWRTLEVGRCCVAKILLSTMAVTSVSVVLGLRLLLLPLLLPFFVVIVVVAAVLFISTASAVKGVFLLVVANYWFTLIASSPRHVFLLLFFASLLLPFQCC